MVSTVLLAGIGASLAAVATAAASGDVATLAHTTSNSLPHGLSIALAHVPSWTHAHEVLTRHLQLYAQNSSLGAASSAGFAGLKKAILNLITR